MKMLFKQTLAASILSSMLVGVSYAETPANNLPKESPPDFVKRVADGLIKRLNTDKDKLKANPKLAAAIVRDNLDPYVDATAFTRTVMGTYANKSSPEQRVQFEKNLRQNLIDNYGSSFSKFSNQTYTMRPYKDTKSKNPVVTIDFIDQKEKTPVSFQLAAKNNQWKIKNMSVAGIDLGLQFRNQFAANVKRNGGNIDKAIATFKPDAEAAVDKK